MEIPKMIVSVLDSTDDAADAGRMPKPTRPDPQVPERARRRTFTAQYKLDILTAYDTAGDGEKGALLRREGLYSSHIVDWRRARDAGGLEALKAPRGRRGTDARDRQIARLTAENTRLEQELAKASFVVDVQAKLHALWETLSGSADTERRSSR
jgi:transposase-like protein